MRHGHPGAGDSGDPGATGDRFESALADWLEDGPEIAPAAPIGAALTHAAVHPRSARRTLARRIRRDGWMLVAAVLVAAVTGAALTPTVRLRDTAAPPAPASVTGTESCEIRVCGQTLTPQEGVDELHGRIDVCQEAASDARASGEMTRHVDGTILPGTSVADVSSNFYGTLQLHNPGGTWSGVFVATYSGLAANRPGRMTWTAIGSGRYRGLVYIATFVADGAGHSTLTGSIDPIGVDAAVASTWCWVTSSTPDVSVENAPERRVVRDCRVTSSDDRITGTATENRTIKVAPDGSTEDIGTLVITTVRGTWTGTFGGTGNWYAPGLVTGTLDGGRARAGKRLSVRIYSEDGMRGALVAELSGP